MPSIAFIDYFIPHLCPFVFVHIYPRCAGNLVHFSQYTLVTWVMGENMFLLPWHVDRFEVLQSQEIRARQPVLRALQRVAFYGTPIAFSSPLGCPFLLMLYLNRLGSPSLYRWTSI
ncbi:hypothetical protein JB92DRAFT_232454 [Gautieria morchelliformis]|nr:hypothetical protein JB92DRAFT_232433 [Gautieria morchelliformis]KAF8513201.1 hypothetical protein JB92DRAFT_232454 [Gautieria morchelliformis]